MTYVYSNKELMDVVLKLKYELSYPDWIVLCLSSQGNIKQIIYNYNLNKVNKIKINICECILYSNSRISETPAAQEKVIEPLL